MGEGRGGVTPFQISNDGPGQIVGRRNSRSRPNSFKCMVGVALKVAGCTPTFNLILFLQCLGYFKFNNGMTLNMLGVSRIQDSG